MENNEAEALEIELGWSEVLRKELLVPRHLAGATPDATFEAIRIAIGSKPIAVDLREFYLSGKQALPADMTLFNNYQIWLVTYSVGVLRDGKSRPLDKLGFKVVYQPTNNGDVTIIDTLPRSRFVTKIAGVFQCSAELSIDGHAALPSVSDILPGSMPANIGGRTSLSLLTNGMCRIGFEVASPQVLATGVASTTGEWIIERESTGLLGDHLFKHTILAPRRGVKELKMKVRVYGIVGGVFRVPVRIDSNDVDLQCRLVH